MNKPVHLGFSILKLNKILMRSCIRFIVYVKTDDIYKDIAEDVETRFDNSNYELDGPLPKGADKK